MAFASMSSTDQVLLERLGQGDKKALRELFDQYYPYLVSVVLAHHKDLDMAKDVSQEVFIQIWQKREELTIQSALKPYLRRAAINRMLNRLKSKKFQVLRGEDMPESSDPHDTPLKHLEGQELANHLQGVIEQLPEKCRLVFQLCRMEGLSHKEIAERLDISPKTIENQMTKALKILRTAVSQYEDKLISIGMLLCLYLTHP